MTPAITEELPEPMSHRVRNALGRLALSVFVLSLTIAISPGLEASQPWAVVVAAVFCALLGSVLRPVLVRVLAPMGWWGAFLLALFANAIVMYIAIELTPGIEDDGFWSVFVASWIYGVLAVLFEWLLLADADDAFLSYAITSAHRRRSRTGSTDADGAVVPGVVFVQLDGVPFPVLDLGIRSGTLPNLSRWVRSGSHVADEWTARVPCTTPVSQAGILHGTVGDMPAFRWYEKDSQRLVVSNHPPDAAYVEARISNGRGLLADDGVSVSNLFSGDAPESLLTMSGMKRVRDGLGPSQSYAAFFTHPYGFVRAFVLTVGEMLKELYQGRRQRRLDVSPRIDRHGKYVLLRGVTNVMLRDLNVALVTEAMMSGAPSIYVDFVDYDEVAHHAGVVRPESLRSLEGLDGVLGLLEKAAARAPRPYHFVVLSDHGQSQGATFLQRTGRSLQDTVEALLDATGPVLDATSAVEEWGPVNVFLSQLTAQRSVTGSMSRRLLRGRTDHGSVRLGPDGAEDRERSSGSAADGVPEVVVVGSGNLGGIWFPRIPGRVVLEDLEQHHAGVVLGLVRNPAVGFLVVDSRAHGPVAIGSDGVQHLRDGVVEGVDPLAGFDQYARADLLHVAGFAHAPDIYLNSAYDAALDEVAAFEELVGCHGGLGGWQTRPMLVRPAGWELDADLLTDGTIRGAEVLHVQLVRWLERLGQRTALLRGEPEADEPVARSSG
jgi:uncharacterized membrane protein YvlD (DUF360 family)